MSLEIRARRFRSHVGVLGVVLLAAVPAALWLLAKPVAFRFATKTAALASLGQLTGLVGFALFALTLVFSGRFAILEKYFGGLDRLYRVHRRTGALGFALLLLHPLFLTYRLVPVSLAVAARMLLPSRDLANNIGVIALYGMIAVMAVTVFGRFRYEAMKFMHRMFGPIFFFGGAHAFLVSSDASRFWPLRGYLLALTVAGGAAFLYRSVLGRVLVKRKDYVVSSVAAATSDVVEVSLKPLRTPLRHIPGQFMFVEFLDHTVGRGAHPFSISSSSTSDELRFAVKMLGDFTGRLPVARPNTRVRVEGPYGVFSYRVARYRHQIWIAGGIGVTPFLGMIRTLRETGSREDYAVDFYYAVKSRNDFAFLEEISAASKHYPGLRILPFATDQSGRLDAKKIAVLSRGVLGKDIFICGPVAMMQSLRRQFQERRVPRSNIHCEEFQML